MKRFFACALLTAFTLAPGLTAGALADERGWHRRNDIQRFHEHDYDYWRHGRWEHGRHEGREGWWWVVGGIWYFYPAPVYPYPDPYRPPVVVVPSAPAPTQYWYYCPDPPGYYPYVAQCRTPWTQVVPQPPPPGR